MAEQEIVHQMSNDIHLKSQGVLGVYLFGIVAKGVNYAASDIDIAVLSNHVLSSLDVGSGLGKRCWYG